MAEDTLFSPSQLTRQQDTSGLPPPLSTTDAYDEVPLEVEKKAEANPFSFSQYKGSGTVNPSMTASARPASASVGKKSKKVRKAVPIQRASSTATGPGGEKEDADNPFSFKNFKATDNPKNTSTSSSHGLTNTPPPPQPPIGAVSARTRTTSEAWSDDDDDDNGDGDGVGITTAATTTTTTGTSKLGGGGVGTGDDSSSDLALDSDDDEESPLAVPLSGLALPSIPGVSVSPDPSGASSGVGSGGTAPSSVTKTGHDSRQARIRELEGQLMQALKRAERAEAARDAQLAKDKVETEALEAAVLSIEARLTSATERASSAEAQVTQLQAQCSRLQSALAEFTGGERPDTGDLVARMRAAKESSTFAANKIREISTETHGGLQVIMKQYKAMQELMSLLDHFDTLTVLPPSD